MGTARNRRSRAAVVLVGAVFGTIAVLVRAEPAAACSCAVQTDAEAFARADVVFSGELVEIGSTEGEVWSSTDPEYFVFRVERVYAGEAHVIQEVVTARDGASCGLEIGGRGPYLVFAQYGGDGITEVDADAIRSGLCSGTRSLADAGVPREFGAGTGPVVGAPVETPAPSGPVNAAAIAQVVALVATVWSASWWLRG